MTRRSRSPPHSAIRCSFARRTFSAVAQCASVATQTRSARRSAAQPASCSSTVSSRMPSRSMSMPSATAPVLHRRRHAACGGGRDPFRRLHVHPARAGSRRAHRRPRSWRSCARSAPSSAPSVCSTSSSRRGRNGLCPRGEPSRFPDDPVREQGNRSQPRRRGVPDRGGRSARRARAAAGAATNPGERQGSRASVRPPPGLGSGPRPGDACDGRGHGNGVRRRRPRWRRQNAQRVVPYRSRARRSLHRRGPDARRVRTSTRRRRNPSSISGRSPALPPISTSGCRPTRGRRVE